MEWSVSWSVFSAGYGASLAFSLAWSPPPLIEALGKDERHASGSQEHRGNARLYHYLLIAIGGWLSGRTVLLSTALLSSVEPEIRMIVVNIEKKRIQESPLYEPDADIRESPNIAGRRPGVLTRPGVSRARPGPGTAVVQREVAGAA
jgi:hypothetical protein